MISDNAKRKEEEVAADAIKEDEEATPVVEVKEDVLPGWRAPYSWPPNGITKTHFRDNYGGVSGPCIGCFDQTQTSPTDKE